MKYIVVYYSAQDRREYACEFDEYDEAMMAALAMHGETYEFDEGAHELLHELNGGGGDTARVVVKEGT